MICVENRAVQSTVHSAFLFGGPQKDITYREYHNDKRIEGFVVLHDGLIRGTCVEVDGTSVVAYVTE